MRSKPVVALPEVVDDLSMAAAHYLTWRTDGKAHFLDKYEETVGWIAWNPEQFPRCGFGTIRRAIIKETYYLIYFIEEPEQSLVLAVLDGRRSPAVIKRTITQRANRL